MSVIYTVKVLTGNKDTAGTDAEVRINLLGPKNSGFIELDNNDNNFERYAYDHFEIPVKERVGNLTGVQFVLSPSKDNIWLIDTVIVWEQGTANRWLFMPNKPVWYQHNNGSGTVLYAQRTLTGAEVEEPAAV